MRVIGGSAGGRVLSVPKGARVRPTADRVKEAVFSILTSRLGTLQGLSVLDVFAGTGNVGIEALSRGAAKAFFIDNHPESLKMIQKNLQTTGFENKAELIRQDALKGIESLHIRKEAFDFIFVDPPYNEITLTEKVLQQIAELHLTVPGGMIVTETANKTLLNCPEQLSILDKRTYGDTAIWILSTNDVKTGQPELPN